MLRLLCLPAAGFRRWLGRSARAADVNHSSAMPLFYTCRWILRMALDAVDFLVFLAIVLSSEAIVTDGEYLFCSSLLISPTVSDTLQHFHLTSLLAAEAFSKTYVYGRRSTSIYTDAPLIYTVV